MRKLILPLLLMAVVMMFTACEDRATIKIHNRTGHLVYANTEDAAEHIIQPDEVLKLDVPANKDYLLWGGDPKQTVLYIKGETYRIYDDWDERYVDSTEVAVEPGKTHNIYIDSNRAGIKVINNSGMHIIKAEIFKHNYVSPVRVGIIEDIPAGVSKYLCVDYAMPNEYWYYYVEVTFEDNSVLTYGGQNTVLRKGDLFTVTGGI